MALAPPPPSASGRRALSRNSWKSPFWRATLTRTKSLPRAATAGHAGAQYNLGVLYNEGLGVKRDYGQAREWYEKAAAASDSEPSSLAQYNLGILYYKGQGVPQDLATARRWWEKSAAQGYANAQQALQAISGQN